MSNFTAINHPGVEDPALKKEPVESDFEIHEDPDVEQGDREDAPPASTNGKKVSRRTSPRKFEALMARTGSQSFGYSSQAWPQACRQERRCHKGRR